VAVEVYVAVDNAKTTGQIEYFHRLFAIPVPTTTPDPLTIVIISPLVPEPVNVIGFVIEDPQTGPDMVDAIGGDILATVTVDPSVVAVDETHKGYVNVNGIIPELG
jgi:hypothetical protein